MKITAHHVDAFTDRSFSGNPTVVITEADGLSDEIMLSIANEVYLSETSFVTKSALEGCDFRFRFFTPSGEYNMSGHSFIASCFALIHEGKVTLSDGVTTVYIETNNGKVPVYILFSEIISSGSSAEKSTPSLGTVIDGPNAGTLKKIMIQQEISNHRTSDVPVSKIAEILGIDEREILDTGLSIEIVKAGIEVMLLPIKRKETLLNLKPDLIKLSLLNKEFGIQSNHLFTLDTFNENSTAYTRGFVPSLGLWEDPASGTSSAALGWYLRRHNVTSSSLMVMEQGNDINNLAKILVEKDDTADNIESILVGGVAALSIDREIIIEENSVSIV